MRILILCTGNRCRSQMAHGILKHLAPEWEVTKDVAPRTVVGGVPAKFIKNTEL